MNAQEYITEVLGWFNMSVAKCLGTSRMTNIRVSKEDCLMYTINNMRFHTAYVVRVVTKFMWNPSEKH